MFYSPIPLDNKQFLPRGSILRNVKWICGVVVYSGHETRLMLKQFKVLSKESKMDKIVDLHITIILTLIFFLSLLCSICCTWWTKIHFKKHWYLESKSNAFFILKSLLLLLYNYYCILIKRL